MDVLDFFIEFFPGILVFGCFAGFGYYLARRHFYMQERLNQLQNNVDYLNWKLVWEPEGWKDVNFKYSKQTSEAQSNQGECNSPATQPQNSESCQPDETPNCEKPSS